MRLYPTPNIVFARCWAKEWEKKPNTRRVLVTDIFLRGKLGISIANISCMECQNNIKTKPKIKIGRKICRTSDSPAHKRHPLPTYFFSILKYILFTIDWWRVFVEHGLFFVDFSSSHLNRNWSWKCERNSFRPGHSIVALKTFSFNRLKASTNIAFDEPNYNRFIFSDEWNLFLSCDYFCVIRTSQSSTVNRFEFEWVLLFRAILVLQLTTLSEQLSIFREDEEKWESNKTCS